MSTKTCSSLRAVLESPAPSKVFLVEGLSLAHVQGRGLSRLEEQAVFLEREGDLSWMRLENLCFRMFLEKVCRPKRAIFARGQRGRRIQGCVLVYEAPVTGFGLHSWKEDRKRGALLEEEKKGCTA